MESSNAYPESSLSPLSNVVCDFSPVCQIDGNDSPPPTPSSNQVSSLHPVYTTQSTSNPTATSTFSRVRTASYTLDRSKQVSRLGHDTTTRDFTVNISKNKENVNIDCNVGFYTTVAVPAIQHLAATQKFVCQGVSVHCQDIVGTFDATQAQQNTVIFFRLSKDKVSIGCVRIHLHHTTRKVQLQGGALLAGEQKAPVWFVENVLKENFTKLSYEKASDISDFNQAVSRSLTSERVPSKCAGCNGQFNGRSNPAFCKECKAYFHKFKCFPTVKHKCYQNKSSQSIVTVPALSNNIARDALPVHQALVVTDEQQAGVEVQGQITHLSGTVTPAPSTTGRDVQQSQLPTLDLGLSPSHSDMEVNVQPVGVVPLPPGVVPQLPALHPRATAATVGNLAVQGGGITDNATDLSDNHVPLPPRLNPDATPFIIPWANNQAGPNNQDCGGQTDIPAHLPLGQPLPLPPTGNSSQTRSKSKQRINTLKNAPATDKVGFELECKRKQLVAAEAKIQELETEITKLRKTNYILSERIKMFENGQDKELFGRYFPPHPSNNPYEPPRSQQSAGCSHHHCCAPPSVVQCHSRCHGPPLPVSDIAALVKELSEKVAQLSGDTATIKSVINTLVKPDTKDAKLQVSLPLAEVHTTVVTSPPHSRPTELPLSPDIVVIETTQDQVTTPQAICEEQLEYGSDESMISDTNTIEEFVFE